MSQQYMTEAINSELRGKYLLLYSGYAMLLHLYDEHKFLGNTICLELELEDLETSIKALKKEYRKRAGHRWR